MIGIFDSGLGGLSALSEVSKIMPYEDIVYLGDTGRVPYGSRSRETILKYSLQNMRFLMTHSVDAVLVACGTASSVALGALRREFPSVPVFGVIDGAAEKAVRTTKNGVVGIIATSATINSGSYVNAVGKLDSSVKTVAVACPLFVHLVENNFIDPGDDIPRLAAERYLEEIRRAGADTLILGCTHYPIISPIIEKVLPGVAMINNAKEGALSLSSAIAQSAPRKRKIQYFITDTPQNFVDVAKVFLGCGIENDTVKIDIDNY